MYSPIRDFYLMQHDARALADQDSESELVMKECIRPWLRLVHSITPGAKIILVCSHLESPPVGYSSSDAEWRDHVQQLAECVYDKVCPQCTQMTQLQDSVLMLTHSFTHTHARTHAFTHAHCHISHKVKNKQNAWLPS
jgi:hypothetical protein